MATPGAVTWLVGGRRCIDAAQRQEEAAKTANDLHEPAAAAADEEVSANSVPRSAGEGRVGRVAWTYSDAGQKSRVSVVEHCSGPGRALGPVYVSGGVFGIRINTVDLNEI